MSSSSAPVESDVEREMKMRCTAMDTHNTGCITIAQLQSVMQAMGEDVSEADVEDMVTEAKCTKGKAKRDVDYLKFITAFHAAGDDDAGDGDS